MRKIEIKINDKGIFEVNFNGIFSHRDVYNLKRAITVGFKRYHYKLLHNKEKVNDTRRSESVRS